MPSLFTGNFLAYDNQESVQICLLLLNKIQLVFNHWFTILHQKAFWRKMGDLY